MGFNRIQAVPGLTDDQAHQGALWIAGRARDAADGWGLLEACGLVPYESCPPRKSNGQRAAVIKYPRPGQS